MDIDKLKKDLSASRAKATRLENARKKTVDDYSEKDDEIRTLKEQIDDLRFEKDEEIRRLGVKIEELQKLAFVSSTRNYSGIGYFCSARYYSTHVLRLHVCGKQSGALMESPTKS